MYSDSDSLYGSDSNESEDEIRGSTRQDIAAVFDYARQHNINPYDADPSGSTSRTGQSQRPAMSTRREDSVHPPSNMNRDNDRNTRTPTDRNGTSVAATQNTTTTDTVATASTNRDSQGTNGNSNTLTAQQLQNFMVDQMTKVQEQNDILKEKIETLEKEQESYYVDNAQRLESGFKDINKVITDMSELKKLFKEVVGIMSGDRLRFLDHSEENAVEPPTRLLATPINAVNTGSRRLEFERRIAAARVMERDTSILNNSARIIIKQESDGMEGYLPALTDRYMNARNNFNGRSTSILNRTSRVRSENPNDEAIRRTYLMEDENNLNAIVEAQRNGERELENSIRIEQWREYKINTAVQNVYEVAKEYYEGFPGKPSLIQLERKFGSTWRRKRGERTLFAKRKCIINRIENVLKDPKKYDLPDDLTRNQAIKVVENIRLGNNNFKGNVCLLTLAQLYEYFSKKKDVLTDYALTVKQRGIPRRSILQRQREQSQSETGTENGTPENRSLSMESQQELGTFNERSYTPARTLPAENRQSNLATESHEDETDPINLVRAPAYPAPVGPSEPMTAGISQPTGPSGYATLEVSQPTGLSAPTTAEFSQPTGPTGSRTSGFSQPTGPTGSTPTGFTQPTGPTGSTPTGFTQPTGPSGSTPTGFTEPTGSSDTTPATDSQSTELTGRDAIRAYTDAARQSFRELLL